MLSNSLERSYLVTSVSIKTKQGSNGIWLNDTILASINDCHLSSSKKSWSSLASPKRSAPLLKCITAQLACTVHRGAQGYSRHAPGTLFHQLQWIPVPTCLPVLSLTRLQANECKEGNGSISVEKLLWVCRHHRQVVANAHHVWSTRSVSLKGGEKELRREAIWSRGMGWGSPMVLRVSSVYKEIFHHFQSRLTSTYELLYDSNKLPILRTLNIYQRVTPARTK